MGDETTPGPLSLGGMSIRSIVAVSVNVAGLAVAGTLVALWGRSPSGVEILGTVCIAVFIGYGASRLCGINGGLHRIGTARDFINASIASALTVILASAVAWITGWRSPSELGIAAPLAWIVGYILLAAPRFVFNLMLDGTLIRSSSPGGPESAEGHRQRCWEVFAPDVQSGGDKSSRPRVLVISLTPVTDEPRVRRQAAAMSAAGWAVTVAGYPGNSPKPADWELVLLDPEQMIRDWKYERQLAGIFEIHRQRAVKVGYWLLLPLSTILPGIAERFYWVRALYSRVLRALQEARRENAIGRYDLVIAHDWFAAPIGARLADEDGARLTIDCHEYASGQYMHSLKWRLRERQFVVTLEKRYLPRADVVTTVCDGIAELLHEQYALPRQPLVIRSTAAYRNVTPSAVGDRTRIVYSGLIDPIRGLDYLVRSLPRVDPRMCVILRGPDPRNYSSHLQNLARRLGVADRLTVEPPVPFGEIVPTCALSDIGYFVHEDVSPQKRFVLPNKFFEYIMAGLALCVSDLPEMARLVKRYDLGVLVSGYDVEAIARMLDSLTPEKIEYYKGQSRKAAGELCWENESGRMLAAYSFGEVGQPLRDTSAAVS